MEWAILEDLKGEKASSVSLLLQLGEGWGVSLDGFSLLPLLLCEEKVEASEPELEEISDEEESPILPSGGRARSCAGKRTLLCLLSIRAGTLSPQHRSERFWVFNMG